VKSYVRNTINLSWDKILLTSVIEAYCVYFDGRLYEGNLKSVLNIPNQFGACV
jgi:hypothetical protein